MPRGRKNPNAVVFDFVLNPEKELAVRTLSNYKRSLNHITDVSVFEHERDESKPIIKTKADLLAHTDHVLFLLNEHLAERLTKSATLAAIFYAIGRQGETHPYVTEFRRLYYTPSYVASQAEKAKLLESAKDGV